MNGDFARSCSEHEAFNLGKVADVPLFKLGKSIFAYVVHSDINLDFAHFVVQVKEVSLAHVAPCHNSAANAYIEFGSFALGAVLFEFFKLLYKFVRVHSLLGGSDFKRVLAFFLQRLEFCNSVLPLFAFARSLFLSHFHCRSGSVLLNIINHALGIVTRFGINKYIAVLSDKREGFIGLYFVFRQRDFLA